MYWGRHQEVTGHCHRLSKTEARWLRVNQMKENGVIDLTLTVIDLTLSGAENTRRRH